MHESGGVGTVKPGKWLRVLCISVQQVNYFEYFEGLSEYGDFNGIATFTKNKPMNSG
jgi:hypothetical protein